MNRTIALVTALATLPLLAGCVGYPPDAARVGDTITVRYDAIDLATEETLATGQEASFKIGAGGSPLGFDIEHATIGRRPNERFTVDSRDDPGRAVASQVRVPATLDRSPISNYSIPRSNLPQDVVKGQSLFDRAGNELIVVELYADVGIIIPAEIRFPVLGLGVNTSVQGTEVVRRLFLLDNRPAFEGPLPGLLPAPGTYRAVALDGDEAIFDHGPGLGPFLGRDVRFTVTVLAVERGAPPPADEPRLASRVGPNLGGDPRRLATE